MPDRERTDTERLDWFSEQHDGHYTNDFCVHSIRCEAGQDVRAAIDAAMDAGEGEE